MADGDDLRAQLQSEYERGRAEERERIRLLARQYGAIYDGSPNAPAPEYEEFASLLD